MQTTSYPLSKVIIVLRHRNMCRVKRTHFDSISKSWQLWETFIHINIINRNKFLAFAYMSQQKFASLSVTKNLLKDIWCGSKLLVETLPSYHFDKRRAGRVLPRTDDFLCFFRPHNHTSLYGIINSMVLSTMCQVYSPLMAKLSSWFDFLCTGIIDSYSLKNKFSPPPSIWPGPSYGIARWHDTTWSHILQIPR